MKEGIEKPSVVFKEKDAPRTRPHFTNSKITNIAFDASKFICSEQNSDECVNKTSNYKVKILEEFKRILHETKEESEFLYNVNYSKIETNATEYCHLLEANVRTLSIDDSPFDSNEIGTKFPGNPLFTEAGKSCAIVASSGSLKNSNLGKFIGK